MLISAWLTAVRSRFQGSRVVKRRQQQKQAALLPESLEARTLLTTTLQAVRPNVGEFLSPGETRTIAPQELTLQFSLGSSVTPASITADSIKVLRSGFDGSFVEANEVPVTIGYAGIGSVPNEVVVRFGETLVDEHYRIVVTGTGATGLKATVGGANDPVADATFDFELDLGAKIVAVDPQPVSRNSAGVLTQARNKIDLYFNEDKLTLGSAENENYYQLIATKNTVSSLDDVKFKPTSAVYNSAANKVTLTFASDIATLAGEGSYRLRVGNAELLPPAPDLINQVVDPGSSFGTARSLGSISGTNASGKVISSSIDPAFLAFEFPGAGDEPGHREVEVENHLKGGGDSGSSGIPYIDYNFKDIYGTVSGQQVHNLITAAQKQRAREIFEYYGEISGIDFRETASSGLTIVTGDLRALDPMIPTGPGGVAGLAKGGTAIMDMGETWTSGPGGSWFGVAMHEIGHLLGQGHTYDLSDPTVQGSGSDGSSGTGVEATFLGDHDIVHMQYMHRPDSIDIDLYRFNVTSTSLVSAEIMAERLADSSQLDSVLRLYRQVGGKRELIAQNDDYFSKDSFLELTLEPGVYFIGVSSTGNDAYDPTIANTGIGGTSEGAYDLRLNFRPDVIGPGSAIVDKTGRTLDGDNDELEGGVYNFWFTAATAANTLFVDKMEASFLRKGISAPIVTQIEVQQVTPYAVNDVIRIDNEQMKITAINPTTKILTVTRGVNSTTKAFHSINAPIRKTSATGARLKPFGFIGDALSVATPGQVVRIVGNGGDDGKIRTTADNYSYQIGLNTSDQALPDGAALEAPQGVTVMIDKGAILKLRRGWLGVGSSTTAVDRSGSALQVLGTPNRQVILTSWNDETLGTDTTVTPTVAGEGDWGGIIFRNEIDRAQNQFNPENEGIFPNYVGNADIRWGGGPVTIDSITQTINAIHMDRAQPTIVNNTIQFSQDSAMSADPDSFEELTFHSPRFQSGKNPFTVDYKRVGPEIHGNTLLNNGNNALFVRIDTISGNATQTMTVPGRFNDTDIVHLVAQNLVLTGTPGGAFEETVRPTVTLVALSSPAGGTLAAGTYNYRVAFTDENGFESPASDVTGNRTLAAPGSIRLSQLPQVPNGSVYTGRRIYRSDNTGAGTYTLIAEMDKSKTIYTDTGVTLERTLPADPTQPRDRARLDARLSIDPGIVVKLQGARIQAGLGAQVIAEGAPGRQVIFTSRLDDRFGAGGTFDTNNDDTAVAENTPSPGDWGGLYISQTGSASIERALITFGGGNVPNGSGFATFSPIEIHQADVRVRYTTFEQNADGGLGGNRAGLFSNAAGTIFVRGAQPVLLDNTFINNQGAAVNINVNALNKDFVTDPGRSTGLVDRQLDYGDNQGALIRDNVQDGNSLNGMIVRGETLTTQSIWDDTDIVHILQREIYVPNMHTFGGIRLESSSTESLVVKLSGDTAGFTAGGSTLDIVDRIGGMVHIIGQPGQPVILTSLNDDTAGAGFDLEGLLQKDTNGNGPSVGAPGEWRGVNIDRYSHDRNVAVYVEREIADRESEDTNFNQPEFVGSLAEKQTWADENLRMGIDLQGFIDNPADVDVYSFSGVAGSQVWIDIDRTTYALDSVIEVLDSDGNLIAQSDNYYDEKLGTWSVYTDPNGGVDANGLDYSAYLSDDRYTINAKDAGLRVVLTGTEGVRDTYFVRVRSSNIDSTTADPRTDLQTPSKITKGLTSGVYQMQIRLQEEDEFAGTTVQYADIRFAETGINITGQPVHSPLAGESEESGDNNSAGGGNQLGNLMDSERAALAVRGTINSDTDVDFFRFEVNYTHTQQIAGVSLTAPHVPVVFDLDYADGLARADLTMAVYDSAGRLILIGRDSNIAEDQPGPQSGNNLDELSRGSVGTFDPFIGSVELPGGLYTLAVTNNNVLPGNLDQFSNAATTTPLLRVEPVNMVRRISEERFSVGADSSATVSGQITNLFDVAPGRVINNVERGVIDPKHVVSYHLGDVVLFVSLNAGLPGSTNETTIGTVNPFTGEVVTVLGDFGQSVGDIAMRPDGQLYAFSTGAANDPNTNADTATNTGNYLRINTGDATTTSPGDDGIAVNLDDNDAFNDTIVAYTNGQIKFTAMTYTGTGDNDLYAIGGRFDHDLPADSFNRSVYQTNILYRFNISSGKVVGNGPDRTATGSASAKQGAGTTQVEIGQVTGLLLPNTETVTGMARVPGAGTFIVTNLGRLYSFNLGSAAASFVANVGPGTSSLSVGPDEVEGGKYAQTLFAATITGDLLAFKTDGTPAPVFVDEQSTVNFGIPGSNGLAFSTLDRNLWQTTSTRGGAGAADKGHGVVNPFDDSLVDEDGGISLYFGNQRAAANAGNSNNLSTTEINNVDFPGGAHGSVISNAFSLEGYRRNDKPTLYFNYFLDTDGTNATPNMRDAFRVFVGDETGTWTLVTTNNSTVNAGPGNDEFDYGGHVEETFDTKQWRQARVDLGRFAGLSNLKLRFDFSTGGSMNLGDTLTTGSELRALDGYKLSDGDIFRIDGVDFEFDMGSTITFPSGATALGKSFTVGGETFTFAAVAGGPNEIVVSATSTANAVRAAAEAVVNGILGPGAAVSGANFVTTTNRLTFPGRTVTGAAGLTVDGAAGVGGTSRVVEVTPNMTANQVAVVIRQALADEFTVTGDITNIKGHEDLVWLIGHDVDQVDIGPPGFPNFVPVVGPLGFADSLPGDIFGGFNSIDPSLPGVENGLGGSAKTVEGVYVDDIIIGFAERGEMVINSTVNTTFFDNPKASATAILQGSYDLEIRRASDYAETADMPPTNGLYKDIDTNDREAQRVSITLPSAANLVDGSTLTISDGVHQVIFEFIDSQGSTTPTPGSFPILFDPALLAVADPAVGILGDHDAQLSYSLATQLRDFINGQTVQNVLAVKASSSDGSDGINFTASTSSILHLTGNAIVTVSPDIAGSVTITAFNAFGDDNHYRDQGQLIISSSSVTNSEMFGISADAAARTGPGLPGPGSVRNLHTINADRLITGVVIANNVIAGNLAGGIKFSGDQAGNPNGQVPYGRIINNTIVGTGAGTGVLVEQEASPTLLNNIIADFATGIDVDVASRNAGTTIGSTVYRGNLSNTNPGTTDDDYSIFLSATDPLFVDQSVGNYYLAPLSRAIDSALTSLGDRAEILAVKDPLDLDGADNAGSQLLAPEFDLYGQPRGNDPDVETPAGQGASVVYDRGAIDRVDFFEPIALLVNPEDQSLLDGDPDVNEVWIDQAQTLTQFRVRFEDQGIGVDHTTLNKNQFVLKRVENDGITETVLIEGVDYRFAYNEVTREAILTAATFFADENTELRYIILVDNNGTGPGDTVNGIRDLAGNYLLPNRADGTTRFDIVLTDGVNDPPEITAPNSRTVNEDTTLVFRNQSISIFDQDAHLGTNVLKMQLIATNGRLTLGSIPAGLIFSQNDGTNDVKMTFTGSRQDINTALNGLQFRPTKDYFGSANIRIIANDLGEFSGPPAITTKDIVITVKPVNDAPSFNPLSNPATVGEDAGRQRIVGFMTGQIVGPSNEKPPQTIVANVTVVSETGPWTPSDFFSYGPVIYAGTGDLVYQTAKNVNGTATIRVVLQDSEGALSAPQTFVINVTPVNDKPVYTLKPDLRPTTSNEDAGFQSVIIPRTFAVGPATALDEINTQTAKWVLDSGPTVTSGNLAFDSFRILPDGTLRYKAAKDTAGSASLTVRLQDNGSRAAPNVYRTSAISVRIVVKQINDAPVASSPNYVVDEGYSLRLDASGSSDVDQFFGDKLTYAWDLDNNGSFETAHSGNSPFRTVSWSYLAGLGITAPNLQDIRLKVTDRAGATDIITVSLKSLIVDYGDAKNSYGTLKSSDGAAHTITGNLLLGETRDKERDGQPTYLATGDGSDEDGVQFPVTFETAPGRALPAFVDVTSTGAGKLDIWLDLNGDGVFSQETEHLNGGVSFDVVSGVNRIFFDIPAGSSKGVSTMRFRLSSAGSLLPTGRASNGEVEDYSVKILGVQRPVTPTITHPIDFSLSDGLIPLTTDKTPTVVWSQLKENYTYKLVVRNSSNNIVFARNQLTEVSQEITKTLQPGIYSVELTAFSKMGRSAPVATYQFEVVSVIVSSPKGGVGTSNPTIEWNPVAGTSAYTVQIDSLTTGTTVLLQTFDVADTGQPAMFIPSDLDLGRYRVRVRATDSADLPGDWSKFSFFQIRTAPVVSAPVAVVTDTLRPVVSWDTVPGARTYRVELYNLTDRVPVQTVPGIQTTSWVPTADLKLAKYRVVVTAFNAAGESSFQSVAYTFNIAPVPVVINPFGRLNDATPTFGWESVLGAERYRLIVRRNFGNFGVVYRQNNLSGNATIHGMTTPLPLGRYTYEIIAINDGQPDAYSRSSGLTKFTVAESPVITGPSATTFAGLPTFTWNNPPLSPANAKNQIRISSLDSSGDRTIVLQRQVRATSFTPPQNLAIGSYVVEVRTYSSADPGTVSEWSVAKNFRITTAPVLIGPSGRTADATPTLNWQGVPGGETYHVQVNSLSENVMAYDVTGIRALNFTVPSSLPLGRYTFRVQAETAYGEFSDFSDPLSFQIVAAPVLTGPSSSTFDRTPSFSWTNMTGFVGGVFSGATSYDFSLNFIPGTGEPDVNYPNVTGLRGTSYTIPNNLPDGLYRAQVRAVRPDLSGDFSELLEFYVGGRPVVNGIGTTADTTPTITWRIVDGASGYNIFISRESNPSVAVVQQANIGATSYTVPFVLAKGQYRVWVQAVNASNGQLSGPALSGEPSIRFEIVDASELKARDFTATYTLTSHPVGPEDFVSESSISMLPSVVSGSSQDLVVTEDQPLDAELPGEGAVPDASAVPVATEEASPRTDEVLSEWDQNQWWDSVAVVPAAAAEEQQETVSASVGFLGAILALAPWSARRRRRNDDST